MLANEQTSQSRYAGFAQRRRLVASLVANMQAVKTKAKRSRDATFSLRRHREIMRVTYLRAQFSPWVARVPQGNSFHELRPNCGVVRRLQELCMKHCHFDAKL